MLELKTGPVADATFLVPLPTGRTLETDAQVFVACLQDGKLHVVTAPAQD